MGQHRQAFEAFAEQIIGLETVERVVLFGSVARGDHGARSDVDILIEVSSLDQQDNIESTAFSTASAYGVSITPVIVEQGQETSFLQTVENEGVEYVRG
ncbi:MAG: nucleotidyltransferase domain-containing protein [Candidatus Nanohaloarchaea archaeon]|nr:nucleotidyltransferase domain-containing protein [Candidatus Nanohaloarchaea archaeon]